MTTPTTPPIVYLDTETTSLRPSRQIWEVGAIREDGAEIEEYQAYLPVDLSGADPASLAIGRFYERHPHGRVLSQPDPAPEDLLAASELTDRVIVSAAGTLAKLTHGAIIIGAVPWFDTERGVDRLLRRYGMIPAWRYHLVDVETFAAGVLRMPPPWDFDALLREFGLTYREEDRHTALGDARMVRSLYKAALGAISFGHRATAGPVE